MEQDKQNRSRVAAIPVIAMVCLVYVLSIGPAIRLVDSPVYTGYPPMSWLNMFYAPVNWLYDFTPLKKPLELYIHFWESI